MRILFLSQRFLLPMDTGGKIRTGKLLEQLAKRHEITIVGNYEESIDGKHIPQIRRFCARFVPVEWREPKRGSLGFYLRIGKHLLSRYPVAALNDYSEALETALLETLADGEFDLAICDFVQSALMFRRVSQVPTVLFQHNVESKIPLRHLKAAENPISRTFWAIQHRRMFAYESNAVHKFDKVIAVSENDANVFETEYGAKNVASIPTGVDVEFYTPGNQCEVIENEIVFCGSMDWLPNEDGIKFFLTEIAGYLDDLVPDWQLVVVGRNPSESLKSQAATSGKVRFTGWVDDVRPYLRSAAVCVVPLRIGGGTRMKIFEAMAMGKAVISTTVGAEGLDVKDDENIRLVDEPRQFASATAELMLSSEKRLTIGDTARSMVVNNFGWDRVAARFGKICADTVLTAAS